MPTDGASLTTDGVWLGKGRGSAFGWLSHPTGLLHRSGVLILPPVGYAWWSSYATARVLAERLVLSGHSVLRLNYHGTGDAPGSQWDDEQLNAWHASTLFGATALRDLGCTELTIVGIRLGATLALEHAEELRADRVIAWAPMISGRREVRAFGMRSEPVPDGEHVSHAGSVIETDALQQLADVDLTRTAQFSGPTLVIDGPVADPLTEHLRGRGAPATRVEVQDAEQALIEAAEDAVVADGVIDTIADWLGSREAAIAYEPAHEPDAVIRWGGGLIRERLESIGRSGLRDVASLPLGEARRTGTVVLLNSGSEPHVGPGRAWVELARDFAVNGIRCLRVDFRGWGESPDEDVVIGRPYDAHGIEDTVDIIAAIEDRGEGPIVLVGLCAGAWTALRAVLRRPVAGVVALNPQLYWKPGDPVEALLIDTRRRRAEERAEEERGRCSGLWDELDAAGERNWAGAWLDELAGGTTDITMLFAEGDDGLEYLHNRLSRRLSEVTASGRLHVREIPEIDHAMHRAWLRPRMFQAIRDAVESALTPADAVDAAESALAPADVI